MDGPIGAVQSLTAAMGVGPVGQAASAAIPTAEQSASFAAAAAQAVPPTEVAASLPETSATTAMDLGSRMSAFADHIQASAQSHAATAPGAAEATVRPDQLQQHSALDDSMASMQSAYVFAIETTMASHGSTEATKIFNTLLKGQ